MRSVIINGFDRCGSSMMCRLLSIHPNISTMLQPCSSTEVHKDLFKVWHPASEHPETLKFFKDSANREIYHDYLKSDWFYKFSNTTNLATSKLNVIKETKCHFKLDWFKKNLPEIDLYGIWRNPRGNLCSLVRNNFHTKWYGQPDMVSVIILMGDDKRYDHLHDVIDAQLIVDDVDKMALIIAVSLIEMLSKIPKENWLVYEDAIQDINKTLNDFTANFGIDSFDYEPYSKEDFNIIGKDKGSEPDWNEFFSPARQAKLDIIFKGLNFPLDISSQITEQ